MLAMFVSPTLGDFTVNMRISTWVQGAMFPISKYGGEVSRSYHQASPHETYGGAGRLVGALQSSDANTIAYDCGAFYFGTGLSFPYFNGRAAQQFVGSIGYHASVTSSMGRNF
eukprot:6359311-Prymnesium_polylepis.1